MKTVATFLITLSLLLSIDTQGQTFQVKDAKQYQYDPSALLNAYGSKNITNNQTYQVREITSYPTPIKSPTAETRVTAYYEEGYGANAAWKSMNLKVEVVTNSIGQDEIKVVVYKDDSSSYWNPVSYGSPSKTYGEIAKEFSYQIYVGAKLVYFNI